MYMCTIKVDENKKYSSKNVSKGTGKLRIHLKKRTENLGTYVTEFLTFTSVVKTSVNQRTSVYEQNRIKNSFIFKEG